jgi:hypothetical protein
LGEGGVGEFVGAGGIIGYGVLSTNEYSDRCSLNVVMDDSGEDDSEAEGSSSKFKGAVVFRVIVSALLRATKRP